MKLYFNSFLFVLGISLLLLSACTKDNIEDITGEDPNAAVSACDSTYYSYANEVVPALASVGCFGCHNTQNAGAIGAGINLEGYDNFTDDLDALQGSVNHDPNYSPMPKGGSKVSQDILDILNCWIENGAENN